MTATASPARNSGATEPAHARLKPCSAASALHLPRRGQEVLQDGAIVQRVRVVGLVELGVIEHATVRLPLVESTPEHLEKLRAGLAASGLA